MGDFTLRGARSESEEPRRGIAVAAEQQQSGPVHRSFRLLTSAATVASRCALALLAHSGGARVWHNLVSLKSILADLRALRDAVEVELDRIVEVQVKFSRDEGCGELDPEAVRESVSRGKP